MQSNWGRIIKMGLEASFQMFQGAYYQAGETGGGRMGQKSYLGRSGGGASTILCTQIITATLLLNIQFTKYIPVSLM